MANFWKELKRPFTILAPMEDVTDFVFRELIAEIAKPDVLFTEFTNIEGLFSDGRKRVIRKLEFSENQHPIVAQIWGSKPENYYKSAKLVADMGFDGVDINMGCPEKKVMKQGCGSAHISDPALAAEIIAATRDGAKGIALSVKTRLGVGKVVTEEWISFLLKQKLDALTIHARIAKDKSNKPADWEEIQKSVDLKNEIAPETILVGNGDVKNLDEADEEFQKYGVDGVMIGRGIFENPWVFENPAKEHSIQESLDLLLKHTKAYVDHWSDTKNFDAMKKFFKVYVSGFSGASDLRRQLMECKSYPQVEKIIHNWNSMHS